MLAAFFAFCFHAYQKPFQLYHNLTAFRSLKSATLPGSGALVSKPAIRRANGDTLLNGNLAKLSLDFDRDVFVVFTSSVYSKWLFFGNEL